MNALTPALIALAPALIALVAAPALQAQPQTCPCSPSLEGAQVSNATCTFADPFPGLRLRTQMDGPLTVSGRRTWKGSALPKFVPLADAELSLQLMDVTSEGYFAVWRNLYGAGSKPNENPRARARLYDCKGTTLWTVELNELYKKRDHLELQDARYVDGILYYNEACQSYAREANGKCSWLVALEPRQKKVLWRTAALTSNGRFWVTKHYIVTIYAFTAEQRFVRVLKRQDGSLVAKAKIVGHHDWAELTNEDLHVRTEESDEYFALDGLRAGTLRTIRVHAGPPTVADAGVVPKPIKSLSCVARGPAPNLTPVISDRTDAAFSNDGRIKIYTSAKEATLVNERHPQGIVVTDNDYINQVVFSPNGDKVAFIETNRGILVHATDDGRLLRIIEEPKSDRGQHMVPFGVQFSGPSQLKFVGGCQQPQAQLFTVDLSSAAPAQPVGAAFQCHGAWATTDARSYLIEDDRKPGAIYRLDAISGAMTPIVQGTAEAPLSDVSTSLNRDWVCYERKWRRTLLFCQHTSDGRLLNLGERGRLTGFAETGARTIIAGGEQDRDTGKTRERVFFVDLEAGTSKELLNAPYRFTGGYPLLFGDGRVLASPTGAALSLCDVTSGAAYTIRERSLYGLFAVPGTSPRMVVSRERSNGVQADLFQLELPSALDAKATR